MSQEKVEDDLKEIKERMKTEYESNAEKRGPSNTLQEKGGESGYGGKALKRYGAKVQNDAKLNAARWMDDRHCVVAAQDGKILMYNATAASSPARWVYFLENTWCNVSSPNLHTANDAISKIAVGGLDNTITVVDCHFQKILAEEELPDSDSSKAFSKHGGPIYCTTWVNKMKFLSGSGDSKTMLWDLNQSGSTVKDPERTFNCHVGDINAIDMFDENVFVTASADGTSKLFDLRIPEKNGFESVVATFIGQTKAVRGAKVLSDTCIANCGEDGSMRVFDMRSMKEIFKFAEAADEEEDNPEYTAMSVSASGRIVYVGMSTGGVKGIDILSGESKDCAGWHQSEITSLDMSPGGYALASCSRDEGKPLKNFAVWA